MGGETPTPPRKPQGARTEPDTWSHRGPATPPGRAAGGAGAGALVPGLVLLYHPDLRRVGQRALLSGVAAGVPCEVSRLQPGFAFASQRNQLDANSASGGHQEIGLIPSGPFRHDSGARPLGDPRISRQPLVIEPDGRDGLYLRADSDRVNYTVDGRPGSGADHLTVDALDRGVLVALADTVLLLAGRFRQTAPSANDHGIIGISDAAAHVRADIELVAGHDLPVLVRGETGAGKERVALAIHAASSRRGKPFVAVNMAAIAPSAAASELFGHKRGAFTDAVGNHPGHFGAADGGTLFLDEVGEMPVAVQALLLRALDEGQVQPVGGAPRQVDVRVIAATDADLEQDVVERRFRESLLHRLQTYTIDVAPLRRRREDIAVLLLHFLRVQLDQLGAGHRLDPAVDHAPPWLPLALMTELAAHDWPGNVRQLRNVATEMALRCAQSPVAAVPSSLHRTRRARKRPASGPYDLTGPATREHLPAPDTHATQPLPAQIRLPTAVPKRRTHYTDDEIFAAFGELGWNVSATAKRLGIARNTLLGRLEAMPDVRLGNKLTSGEIQAVLNAHGGDVAAAASALRISQRALQHRMAALGVGE